MIKDLRKKTDIELGELISKLKIQLLEMRFKIASGEVDGLHKVNQIKKTIAIAMTVLSERGIKISFTTNSIQLISTKDNKQEIKAIKFGSIIEDSSDLKAATNEQVNKQANNKNISNQNNMASTFKNVEHAKTSSKKQESVQIRRSAKG